MILLIFALYYLYGLASGAPTSGVTTTTLQSADGSSVETYRTNYRSTVQIVTSCVSTILLCTWFTVHPDVCRHGSTWRTRVWRKLELFVWALLMPELVMMWACNQWFGARRIRKLMRGKFNIVEAHFVQMGGIRFTQKGEETWMDLVRILERQMYPDMRGGLDSLRVRLTVDEIKDRSKSDGLSKTIVLVQTTWFTAQCIARAVQGLAITELEIVTLAYTVLNGVMCSFWWSKPLDVQCPVRIELAPGQLDREIAASTDPDQTVGVDSELDTETQPLVGPASTISDGKERVDTGRLSPWAKFFANLKSAMKWCFNLTIAIPGPRQIARCPLYGYYELREDDRFKSYVKDGDPTYYISAVVVSSLASLFGAVHCISWAFNFSSPGLQTVWRVCSVFIASSPLVLAIMPAIFWHFGYYHLNNWIKDILLALNVLTLAPLYMIARILLLVIAFHSLSTIPASGHQSIEWADFVPHN